MQHLQRELQEGAPASGGLGLGLDCPPVPSSSSGATPGGRGSTARGASRGACLAAPPLPDCPLSARGEAGARPTTRDGLPGPGQSRGGTQEGCGRLGSSDMRLGTSDLRQLKVGLEGVRPSTREDRRLQQQIGGGGKDVGLSEGPRPSPREFSGGRKTSPRNGVRPSPRDPHAGAGVASSPRDWPQAPQVPPRDNFPARPPTSDTSSRPPTRSGQDVTVRRASSSHKQKRDPNPEMSSPPPGSDGSIDLS